MSPETAVNHMATLERANEALASIDSFGESSHGWAMNQLCNGEWKKWNVAAIQEATTVNKGTDDEPAMLAKLALVSAITDYLNGER